MHPIRSICAVLACCLAAASAKVAAAQWPVTDTVRVDSSAVPASGLPLESPTIMNGVGVRTFHSFADSLDWERARRRA
ncbi:MAG TPA: hypothetical protein VF178_02400, partial [Gemmatimonadaceae bacterium]